MVGCVCTVCLNLLLTDYLLLLMEKDAITNIGAIMARFIVACNKQNSLLETPANSLLQAFA